MSHPLDTFIPRPDICERHSTLVHAPAGIVFQVARTFDLQSVTVIRGIIWLRQRLLRSQLVQRQPQPFLDEALAMGWGRLHGESDRLFVAGAICQPWLADVVFRPLPPSSFATYSEPGHVKIAWTLEVEPVTESSARLSTETRAVATDAAARVRFRRYWRWARFGILPIRWFLLPAIRRQAESASRAQRAM